MKPILSSVASLALVLAVAPSLHAGRKLDRADIKLSVPDHWVEAPDIAEASLKAMGPNAQQENTALCYREPSGAPILLGLFTRTKATVGSDTRQELKDFHTGLKTALEKGGATFTRYDLVEAPSRLVATFEVSQGPVRMVGKAIAAIQADGRVLGWAVECMYAAAKPQDQQICQEVLATFEVVHPEADLRRIKP